MELAKDWKDYEILDMAERRKTRKMGGHRLNKT